MLILGYFDITVVAVGWMLLLAVLGRLFDVPATTCCIVSQGRTCWDHCTRCHAEIELADQTCYLAQSQARTLTPGQQVLELTL